MDPTNWFHLLVSIYLIFHGIWWSKKDLLNLIIKIIFWGLGIWGLILTLKDFGLVLQL